jgi:copper chaperone CopZ
MTDDLAAGVPGRESGSAMLDAVESDAGGSAGVGGRLEVGIQGMSCASCVAVVETALRGVAGVRRATVNLATDRGTVRFDPSETGPAALVQAIADAGYRPVVG